MCGGGPVSKWRKSQHNFWEEFVTINSLEDLYVEQLRDVYDRENQLINALPRWPRQRPFDELRTGKEEHLEQTRGTPNG